MAQRPSSNQSKGPPRGGLYDRLVRPILVRAGIACYLEVPGRRSGQMHRVPLVPHDVDGSWYLLSTYSDSQWVHNLRSAGGGRLARRKGPESFTAVEVDGDERDRVIARFRARSPGMVQRQFDRLPDPADHPAFRVVPTDPPGSGRDASGSSGPSARS